MSKRKTKLFVSGPMTGIEHYNCENFCRYAEMARNLGYRVINPVEMARKIGIKKVLSDKRVLKRLINAELESIKTCDAILMLDWWQNSPGAKKELRVALGIGLEVKLQHDIEMEWLNHERAPFLHQEKMSKKRK
jgi:hypothetical protein